MLNRTKAPEKQTIKDIKLKEVKTSYLSNGIPLHYLNAGDQSVVRLEIAFSAGSWREDKNGISYFATNMLNEGTKKYSAEEIANYIDQYGAFIDFEPGIDYTFITLYSLNKYLENLIPFLQELISDSIFPEVEFNSLKEIKIQNIRINQQKNNVVATQSFRQTLFGPEHPYGRILDEEAAAKIDRNDAMNFYKDFMSNNFELIISGNVTKKEINLIEKVFGQKTLNPVKLGSFPRIINTKKEHQLIEKTESLQSSIRVGNQLNISKAHKDYAPLMLVNEILGGYFGSRLMRNIREEKGYTYGIHSNVVTLKHQGYFVIGTDVKKEFTKNTINEIYKEIEILQTELIKAEELETVKNYMLGSFLASINTPFALTDKFKSIYFNNLNYDFYKNYIQSIKEVDAETIRRLAGRYLNKESMLEVIVGGI
ncbi:M16 family metallopeptidase [Xanthovirga aplysinae]|uniref:M16 family metallopeptidase n=1 Tax=Xanthovirga aplysinae TaxID=2529853 RepID=UPI0012BCBC95|nr:pitrilysin family protein [Xanthovirga aplysinae]MTI32596.1 insulinase family protein [Xanthovirga aplysinae]